MIEDPTGAICHGVTGKGKTGTGTHEEQQTKTASDTRNILAINLMEQVCSPANLNRAYKRVKSNKGSAGVDGLSVNELGDYIRQHKEQIVKSLMDGSYHPQPVRKVMIPKPDGGERQLGIPTVMDRLVQQAIYQVLEPLYEPRFSDSSFGFRPGRSAHDALRQAQSYVQAGKMWVVDMDLEKFFDKVNHDILMSRLTEVIGDKCLLKLIRRFLTAGAMQNGVVMRRSEGAPQGGPLSPLLSNILLDELDKELERRGHTFCRYADDQNIYVSSKRAGERVYDSVKQFLETKLKLKVNDAKSAVALVGERKFLGYRICNNGKLTVAPKSIERAKEKLRMLTRRNRGRKLSGVIREINVYLTGWFNYFKLAETKYLWRKLDSWVRRKLRCYRIKQRKRRGASLAKFLMNLGVQEVIARKVGSSGKGWWRLSRTAPVHRALNNAWFYQQGFISLESRWAKKMLKA